LALLALAALVLTGCSGSAGPAAGGASGERVELINVSYDPTRELYEEYSKAFATYYQQKTGAAVSVKNSHGGSGSQARAVIDGLRADVVTLALASDIDAIAKKGLLNAGWQDRLPNNASPYVSTIVWLVRKGNPKGIKTWDDLAKPGVQVITPNPKTSGGARWNFLAAWGHVTQSGGSESQAGDFVGKVYANAPVLDSGARGATATFVERGIGDVLIAWENEAILALRDGGDKFEIVYPTDTILAEPPVAVVDANVDKKKTRAAAEEFLKYLYSDAAQEIIAKNGYRPSNPQILAKYSKQFPTPQKLVTIKDFGGWEAAQAKFFNDGGVFDQVYKPR
jgi:sulfate transport system substrate-binding protein